MKRILVASLFFLLFSASSVWAFWVWTPETNQWINPKYSVKPTPAEQLQYAKDFYNAKEFESAVNEFKKLIRHYPKAREAAEAQYYLAKCSEDEGKLYEAFKAYQVIIEKYPFSDLIGDIVKQQYKIGNDFLEGKEKRKGFVKAVVGDNYNVIDIFKTVIKNAPYGEFAAPSQYKIGLYLQENRLYQEARDEFEKVMNDYPDSEWSKAAKYQIALVDAQRSAKAEYDQGITNSAVEEFKEFVEIYPDAEFSQAAHDHISQLREKEAENNFLIARFYEKQKKYTAARIYYSTVVEDYKNTSWAPKALEKLRDLNTKISQHL